MAKKILIAEDDAFISEIYCTKLAGEGYEIEIAEDGKDALEKIQKILPDLILLDLLMPKMNGIEVLEYIKKNKKTQKIPVIVLTNASEKSSVDEAMGLGADDYLMKSNFTPEEVVTKVKKFLN